MENFNRIQGFSFGLPAVGNGLAIKALQSSTQSLGTPGAQANSELVAWYEQAYAYYNAVVSGAEAQPSAQAWQSFLDQMQWAAAQLGYQSPGNSWDPSIGMTGNQGSRGQGVPEGAVLGAMGNVVWNQSEAHIVAQSDPRAQDIWSNEVTLDVTSLSAQVTSEITTDTRLSPPEEVLKIIVKDPATGMESCYFVHDYEDANIEIRTSEQKQIQDASGGLVAWQRYEASTGTGNSHPDASIEGVDQGDGTLVYEPEFAGETVDFWANPGENQVHVVYANANISVKPSDEVAVQETADNGTITVIVKHKDGSTDTYRIEKGYSVNVNVNEEYITLAGQAGTEGIPESYDGRVTLNGGAEDSEDPSWKDPETLIASLLEMTGRPSGEQGEMQLLAALKNSGWDEFQGITGVKEGMEKLAQLISEGKFPGDLTENMQKLIDLAEILQPSLKDRSDKQGAKAFLEGMGEILQLLMPDHIIGVSTDPASKNPWKGSLSVDGETIITSSFESSSSEEG
ncbi:MAG: hypothetical protein U1F66_10100 [bacterium]